MKKKKLIVLIISLLLITGVTFLGGLLMGISILWLKILLVALVNLCNGAIAFSAMKITGMEIETDFGNIKQYGIGVLIALGLCLTFSFIPALFGIPLAGSHTNFSWFTIIYNFLNFILIIGPAEELIFRVYLQDTLISFFEKKKIIGVIIAAFIFGLWHLIKGSLLQVLFTFLIGLVFGLCRYLIKDCKYAGLALGHGLYDFLNSLVRMFII